MNNNKDTAGQSLQDLISWLENDQTRDLVDMINKASLGLPVDAAADRYKARYRHSGSMDKLSEMFDSLEHNNPLASDTRLQGVISQADSCHAALLAASQGFARLLPEIRSTGQINAGDMHLLVLRLHDLHKLIGSFRDQVIRNGIGS